MYRNAASGLVLLVLSLCYYMAADAMPASILDTTVPSSAFPKLLAIAGAILSVALIVQNILVVATHGQIAQEEEEPAGDRWFAHKRALGLLAIVVAFILALETIGYPLAVGLLILAVSRYQGYPLSLTSVLVAVGGGLFFWLFFMVFLGIHMPLGIFSRIFASAETFLPFA